MTLPDALRCGQCPQQPRGQRAPRRGGAVAIAAAAVLAACGGGTSQVETYSPNRMISFGDEASLIVDDGAANGRKYTVNGLDTNAARDCTLTPIWSQVLATHYGFVYAACNKSAATPKAFARALVGAKVGDPATGISAQIAEQQSVGGGLKAGDLVTVMMGVHDLVELNEQVQAGTLSDADARAEARRRGAQLAAGVNAILGAGTRAIVATVPDMGLSPYARTLESTSPGAMARLTQLSYEFNASLRTGIDATRFDGRNYGLVLTDDTVAAVSKVPGAFSSYPANVTEAACVVALPQCTSASADLVASGSTTSHMWADTLRLGPSLHALIGSQAVARAVDNPF